MRCLSRVSDSILWNSIKTRTSSVFQNVEGLLHLGLWAQQTCLIVFECGVTAQRDTFWFHTVFITSTAVLQNQHTFFQTKAALSWFCCPTGHWDFCSDITGLYFLKYKLTSFQNAIRQIYLDLDSPLTASLYPFSFYPINTGVSSGWIHYHFLFLYTQLLFLQPWWHPWPQISSVLKNFSYTVVSALFWRNQPIQLGKIKKLNV